MLRRFAKVALVGVLLLGASCSEFTWTGRSGGIDQEARERGVKSVSALERDYETQRYWAFWRDNVTGVVDSFYGGLHRIHEGLDRNFLNHSWTNPSSGH